MSQRHVLVATYYYPPQPGSGSNRWLAMVKYLRRMGYAVTVLTAAPPGHPAGTSHGVIRTGNLNSNPAIRRVLMRADRTSKTPVAGAGSHRVAPSWAWKGLVPDPWLATWLPYAWPALRSALAQRAVDCLITSSPIESTHLLALALGRSRPAWIADFRDGWCFEPIRPRFPLAGQRALDRELERRVATKADVAVGVTVPIADDLRSRLGARVVPIANGFDPEVAVDSAPVSLSATDRCTLVHTGALLGASARDPRPLLEAIRRVAGELPGTARRLQLLVAGQSDHDERGLLDQAGLGDTVVHLGYIPRAQALGLQRAATALVLLTSDASGEATGKLYEYLAAGRPIIALAKRNEAARIITETATGVVVDPHDVNAIAAALRAARDGELERSYAPRSLEAYTYPAPAIQMAAAIETAMERRRLSGQMLNCRVTREGSAR